LEIIWDIREEKTMYEDKKIDYENEVRRLMDENHINDLQKSGLTFETIFKAGYKSKKRAGQYSSWIINFDNPITGEHWFERERIDQSLIDQGTKSFPKYFQPKDSGCQLYFSKQISNDQWKKFLEDVSIEKFLIEGEKKTDCAIQYSGLGKIFIGLTGVYGWSKNKQLIDFLDYYVAIPGSKITICVDSDYKTNPKIQNAIQELAQLLIDKKIEVTLIIVPGDPDVSDKKIGLDDYLIKFPENIRSDELRKLIESRILLSKSKLQRMKSDTKELLKHIKKKTTHETEFESPPVYIDMVNSILAKNYIEADRYGSLFVYCNKLKYFQEITKTEVFQLALKEDWESASSKRRREEVYSLLVAKVSNPKLHDLWRNIGPFHIPVKNGVIDLESNQLLEHKVHHYLECKMAPRLYT
jgi:hypothetical protein